LKIVTFNNAFQLTDPTPLRFGGPAAERERSDATQMLAALSFHQL
jgi:hypothetical protein